MWSSNAATVKDARVFVFAGQDLKLCPERCEAGVNGVKQVALHGIFRAVDYVNHLISQVFTLSHKGDINLADWSNLGKVLTQNTCMNKWEGLVMECLYIFIEWWESKKMSWFWSFTVITYYFISQPQMYQIIWAFLLRCCIFVSMTFFSFVVCCCWWLFKKKSTVISNK